MSKLKFAVIAILGIAVCALLGILLATRVFGEGFSNDIYDYEAQISWGGEWINVLVISAEVAAGKLSGHFYGIQVVGMDRRVVWEGLTPNSTITNPEIVRISFDLPTPPRWFSSYRARFRPFSIGKFSPASEPVQVIDLRAMPVVRAFVGLAGG